MTYVRHHRASCTFQPTGKLQPKQHIGQFALGIGLYIIGYLGHFFGSLIKAAVSREREYLADASAVQFTRNPEGIGNALRKIGGYPLGAYIAHHEQAYAYRV